MRFLPPKAAQPRMMQPLLFKPLPFPLSHQPYLWPQPGTEAERRSRGRKAAPPVFLLIRTLGHPLGTSRSAWPLVPTSWAKAQADARKSQEGIGYHHTEIQCPREEGSSWASAAPLQNPASLPRRRDTKQSHPCDWPGQQTAFYLPIALEHAAVANISAGVKSPCKQLWSKPLGTSNISLGPSWVFSVLFAGWRAPTLCARGLDATGRCAPPSSLAAGATRPHSSGRHSAARMGSTRETHVAGPGRASAADANQLGHVHTAQAWEKSSTPVARSH